MRRADRLLEILQALRGHRLRTAGDLSTLLEVSIRTVYRDIQDLQAIGVPIDGERGVGYVMQDSYFLPPLALSPLEHQALAWGVAFVASYGDDALAAASVELLVKLTHGNIDSSQNGRGERQFSAFAKPRSPIAVRMLADMRVAIAERRRIDITYVDKDGVGSARTVRPLELQFWGAALTLTAWCELRGDFRVFRCDRIHNVELGSIFRQEAGNCPRISRLRTCWLSSPPGISNGDIPDRCFGSIRGAIGSAKLRSTK